MLMTIWYCRHRFDYHCGTGHLAAVVTTGDLNGPQCAISGEAFDRLGKGRHRMEGHPEFHRHAVADAPLNAATMICFR